MEKKDNKLNNSDIIAVNSLH